VSGGSGIQMLFELIDMLQKMQEFEKLAINFCHSFAQGARKCWTTGRLKK